MDGKIDEHNNIEKQGIKSKTEYYESVMKDQEEDIKKILGDRVNMLMVQTFKDEVRASTISACIARIGAAMSLLFIGIISFMMWKKFGLPETLLELTAKFLTLAPFGVMFWFYNKRNDILTLLSAEYRYKQSVCEAMIGYRAKYETNEGKFADQLPKEYGMFFEKTFEEINKNPAEKINKMLMNTQGSDKKIENIIEKVLKYKK